MGLAPDSPLTLPLQANACASELGWSDLHFTGGERQCHSNTPNTIQIHSIQHNKSKTPSVFKEQSPLGRHLDKLGRDQVMRETRSLPCYQLTPSRRGFLRVGTGTTKIHRTQLCGKSSTAAHHRVFYPKTT